MTDDVRDRNQNIAVSPSDKTAIDAAAQRYGVSSSLLLYKILQVATNDFTLFDIDPSNLYPLRTSKKVKNAT